MSASLRLAAVLLAAAAVPGPSAAPWRATGKEARPDGSGEAVREGVRLNVREIASGERREFLWKHAAAETDPLDVVRDGVPVFRTFVLDVANDGAETALVNPSFFRLKPGGDPRVPLGYSQLYRVLVASAGTDAAVERLAPLLEETSFAVPPGTRAVRLLVFAGVPPGAGKATLELGGVQVGSRAVSARIAFERPRPSR